jgi:quinol-cytochrome oxidoreductase complex cytochrome b subunit
MSISRRVVAWLEERLNLTEIFSFFTTFGLSYVPIDQNKPLEQASKEAFTRELPAYTRGPYILGVLAFLLFVFQGISGLLLALYYEPSPQTAYESTLFIIRDVNFGWYIHQMHHWGSNVLIVLLALRLVRFFVHGVYKKPRELTWVFGVVLLLLSTHAALTGTLLPWDQRSFWSVTRGLEVIAALPIISYLLSLIVGGLEVSQAMLIRSYVSHVMLIPLSMVLFFYLHFATVRKVGLSPLLGDKTAETKPLYPDHLFQLLVLILLLFGVILTLGTVFPSSFSAKADPFSSLAGIGPPWYLTPTYGLVELLPRWLAGVVIILILIGVIGLPFIERAPYQQIRKRPILAGAAAAFCLLVLVLTFIGYRRGS